VIAALMRMNMKTFWILVILLPLLSVTVAALTLVWTNSQPQSAAAMPTLPTGHALEGQMAPNFELPVLNSDQTVRLSSLRGRVVFVNFWATWCAPCRREFPAFEAFSSQADNAVILAVNADETPAEINAFLGEVGSHNVQILLDQDFAISSQYAADLFPATFVIDPAGIIREFHLGEITLDDLNAYVAQYR
jgi:thiol-disulfide isomerase/thioredoxin